MIKHCGMIFSRFDIFGKPKVCFIVIFIFFYVQVFQGPICPILKVLNVIELKQDILTCNLQKVVFIVYLFKCSENSGYSTCV